MITAAPSHNRLVMMIYRSQASLKKALPEILMAESRDSGRSWSAAAPAEVGGGWPEQPRNLGPYGQLVETANGSLVRFFLGGMASEPSQPAGGHGRITNVVTWGSVHVKAFAIRSRDGGKSWSSPVEIDEPSWNGQPRGTIAGSLDFTETTGVAIGNRIMAVVRPVYSPMMWQCWSDDAGGHRDAAARTTFPGYAAFMLRTRSGVILVAHQYPMYSVNISRDGGLNWDADTIIDYPAWAMGSLTEVEPDLVLSTYMNSDRKKPLLYQLIRLTPAGIEPAFHRVRSMGGPAKLASTAAVVAALAAGPLLNQPESWLTAASHGSRRPGAAAFCAINLTRFSYRWSMSARNTVRCWPPPFPHESS